MKIRRNICISTCCVTDWRLDLRPCIRPCCCCIKTLVDQRGDRPKHQDAASHTSRAIYCCQITSVAWTMRSLGFIITWTMNTQKGEKYSVFTTYKEITARYCVESVQSGMPVRKILWSRHECGATAPSCTKTNSQIRPDLIFIAVHSFVYQQSQINNELCHRYITEKNI
jgi:hypothetical protein